MDILISHTDIIIRLAVAAGLGMLMGIERVYAHKVAGMRTYALVSMGAALFVTVVEFMTRTPLYIHLAVDPTRIAAAVVSGIGFLGAGLIIFKDDSVKNLTTAAGLWVAAGIGVAVGFGLYIPAIAATLLVLFVFFVLAVIERQMKISMKKKEKKDK